MKYLISIRVTLILIVACSSDETEVPKAINQPIPEGNFISIAALKSGIDRLDDSVKNVIEDNSYLEGYVISSDKEGNFFKELVLQDKPKKPTAGISIALDERGLHQKYPLGMKLRVRLKGLVMGYKNGVFQLGILNNGEIAPIDLSSIDQHIFRTDEILDLEPLEVTLEEITRTHELLYVTYSSMQFEKQLIEPIPKTISGEINDSFDGFRTLRECPSGLELIMCSSTFASFKNVSLPKGKGQISGVLTRDFRDDFFVIKMNSIADLHFNSKERCEPTFFECSDEVSNLSEIIFEENFEEITNEAKLEPLGWLNINVTGDGKRWEDRKVTNIDNRTLTISAFNSNLRPLEAWLITPEINLDSIDNAVMSVRVRTRFNNGKALRIWVTNEFSGDPLSTNWRLLPLEIPSNSSNFKTLEQNISCLQGKVRVAFQYKGFDPIVTSTYEIDDLIFYSY